jgi:hypothetical protein
MRRLLFVPIESDLLPDRLRPKVTAAQVKVFRST